MIAFKRTFLLIMVLAISFISFSQNSNQFTRFYIKLSPELNFETPKSVLETEAFNRLQNSFYFEISNAYGFTKKQIERLSNQSKNNHTLKNTFKIEAFLNTEDAKQFLNTLQASPNLIYAYQSNTIPIAPPHDIAPVTSDLETNQGYIESNPGLNVRYAWNLGTNGAGINIRAIEYGININHEDLDHTAASLSPNTTINSGATLAFTEHGTSVAGIVFANKGAYGVSGIAHNANEYILYPEWTEEYNYNRVLATSNAIANSTAGDVIIYEMQAFGQNDNFVPAEYEQAIWDLTKAATDAGIVIVAAAGNGNENLDAAFYDSYNALGDSGAIIVGAGTPDLNHNRIFYSTYGSRVNVQAWGDNVFTTGDSCSNTTVFGNDINQTYVSCFAGTSSATALVGGFTAVLQSYYLSQTGNYLTAQELRTLMVNTGIAQGTGNNIGPLPNMEAAILELNNSLSIKDNNFNAVAMYPNPAKNTLNIKLNHADNTSTLKIHNLLGQKVLATNLKANKNTISLNNIPKGLYLVTINTSDTTTTKKLVIN